MGIPDEPFVTLQEYQKLLVVHMWETTGLQPFVALGTPRLILHALRIVQLLLLNSFIAT